MKEHIAIIKWIKEKDGGRKKLPIERYSTAARFVGHDEAWSLVLELKPPVMRRVQVADVRFLAHDAPEDWLHAGAAFQLYEGTWMVAHGGVLT